MEAAIVTLRLVKGFSTSKDDYSSTKNSSNTRKPTQLELLPPLALKAAKVHSLNRGAADALEEFVDRILTRLEGRRP